MANDTNQPAGQENQEASFLSKQQVDTVYSDFFQETSDGKISIGSKAQKAGIEILTSILSYILPIAIVGVVIASAHVFLRTQESGGFAENYQFLCPYMNFGVDLESSERGCNPITKLQANYIEKQKGLEESILKKLNEYIPIKIVKNLMSTSPEKLFVVDTFSKKIHVDEIMNQFKKILEDSQYKAANNIECTGISIDEEGILTTQCTIYGRDIGSDDTNGKLGSSRIEAMEFVENLANTTKSSFILLNPPVSLSSEKVQSDEGGSFFASRTTIPVQIRYVPFDKKS